MNKYRIEFESDKQIGSELIFADSKLKAIKTFLKGHDEKIVVIKSIQDNGYIRANQGLSSIYVK